MAHSENRRRTEMVCMRFLPEERQQLNEAAQARGVGVCELIRQALHNELRFGVWPNDNEESA